MMYTMNFQNELPIASHVNQKCRAAKPGATADPVTRAALLIADRSVSVAVAASADT